MENLGNTGDGDVLPPNQTLNLLGVTGDDNETQRNDGLQDAVPNVALQALTNVLEAAKAIETLHTTFEATGDIDYLDNAVGIAEELASASPNKLDQYFLLMFTRLLRDRCQRTEGHEDLCKAIKWMEVAVTEIPPGNPNRAEELERLSAALLKRYKRYGALEDLKQAIMRAEEAFAATPPDHPDRTGRLSNLALMLASRYDRFGDLQDLEQAFMRTEEALAATPPDHPDHATMLSNLGNRFMNRYDRFGDLQDLEQAIMRAGEALAVTPSDHPDRAGRLNNLGLKLASRYDRFGDLQDLEQAIMWTEKALAATPPDHPDRAGRLSNLSLRLASRYDRLRDPQDLEQAIMRAKEALTATSPDHPDRATMLSNLGNSLVNRYDRFGDPQDLEQAIKWTCEALLATPPDHPDRAGRLNNLGLRLASRYDRLGDLQDLEQAITRTCEALQATPPDHPDRAGRLSNLGLRLASRYDRRGDLQDLEQAIMRAKEALAATPPDHPGRARRLSNLGNMLGSRYGRLRDLQDFEQAITLAKEALAATFPDHPDRAKELHNLIGLPTLKYQHTDSAQDIDYILHIAHKTGLLLASREMWQESSALFEGTVETLSRVSKRFWGRDDQEYHLSNFTRLASEAASIAIQAGAEASHSLRLLELGRGVITGLVIDCRSDHSELQLKQPELFNKFHQLRIEVDSPLVTDNDTYPQGRYRREKAIEELEEALALIRELPGFGRFQLPPCSGDLMAMASEGPIVIFNSTQFRSDAIIITSTIIKALALPELLYSSVEERMSQIAELVQGSRSTYQWRNERMEEILLWLWDVAVEPVFKELQLGTGMAVGTSDLPRIWWIGVGPLAIAPFHAAGDHSPGSTRNTISRAISSYIPTIKSLSYARQKKLELLSRSDSRLLLVTMPINPAAKPLKYTTVEAQNIMDIVEGKASTTLLHYPSTAQVLAELPSCHAIHFACCSVSDHRNPSDSHLILRKNDSSELGTPDKLTVRAISNMNIKQAQIAYLSSCSTAENSSASLVDESIYLASGFQLAGFSHVLAIQWASDDYICLQVAREFYSSLFTSGGERGHRRVSAAFHYAVKRLRDENPRQPIKWACYIHTGA